MFSKVFIAGLACIAPLAAAYTKPVGKDPVGNPISQPGLNSVVPAGEGFTITWKPTTDGTVTLVLLKGPSENAVPQYAIVEKTENDGSYVWTPSTDLEPTDGATGYGIQLIDDATGQYQYTTQFGISNADYKKGSSSSSVEKPAGYGKSSTASTAAPYPTAYHTSAGGYAKPTGTGYWTKPAANVTMVAPTGSYKPTTLATSAPAATTNGPSATYEGPSQQTGAASNVAISFFGLVAAAGAAVLAI